MFVVVLVPLVVVFVEFLGEPVLLVVLALVVDEFVVVLVVALDEVFVVELLLVEVLVIAIVVVSEVFYAEAFVMLVRLIFCEAVWFVVFDFEVLVLV